MSLNSELARMFATMASVLELRGEPVFKSIAFSRVSRLIEDSSVDLRAAVESNTLEEIQGIGKSSRKVIEDFVKTGRSVDFDELTASVPAGLLEILKLPGLGPKTVRLLWDERGITTVDELAAAIDAGKLAGLKGVGEKKVEQIKQSLALRASAGQRVGIVEALEVVGEILERVRSFPGVRSAEFAGSVRRRRETIGDADIIAAVDDAKIAPALSKHFVTSPGVRQILGEGDFKSSVSMQSGLQVDLRIVTEEFFGSTLQYFTGSKDHNKKLRAIALDKGLTLNEWGLFDGDEWEKAKAKHKQSPHLAKGLKNLASRTEADVYRALGLDFIEPELREDRGELELAAEHGLPKLIARDDIRGDLHTHTTASDGTASIEEMAEAAKALGYDYLVITDHSKSQVIANGLDAKRLLKHVEAVRKVAAKLKKFTLLVGSEVDILADGKMDYDDDVLKELDFVVASPHTALRQDVEKATARLLRAIDNKYVNVIGHPTGRLINQRVGLDYDWTKIFNAAADSGTAMEINAGWPRLDLDDVRARAAIAAGVMLTIATDAHSTDGLAGIEFGIGVARRAGAEARHVLNTHTVRTLKAFVAKKR